MIIEEHSWLARDQRRPTPEGEREEGRAWSRARWCPPSGGRGREEDREGEKGDGRREKERRG